MDVEVQKVVGLDENDDCVIDVELACLLSVTVLLNPQFSAKGIAFGDVGRQ